MPFYVSLPSTACYVLCYWGLFFWGIIWCAVACTLACLVHGEGVVSTNSYEREETRGIFKPFISCHSPPPPATPFCDWFFLPSAFATWYNGFWSDLGFHACQLFMIMRVFLYFEVSCSYVSWLWYIQYIPGIMFVLFRVLRWFYWFVHVGFDLYCNGLMMAGVAVCEEGER